MLWVKAFHIVFVAAWFAGLFYLPRIFVNLASVPADSHAERERLLLMARRLYRFAYILMVQRSNFPNSDASDVRGAFQEAAVKAIK